MTCGPTDGGTPAGTKAAPPTSDDARRTLDALAIELGRLAAQQDFGKAVGEEADTDLSSPQGREP
jgi:hypothetical protein